MPDLKDTERLLLLLLETDLAEGAGGNAAFFLLLLSPELPEALLALGAGAGAADLRDLGALFPVSVLAETSESESSSLSYRALGFFAGGCAGGFFCRGLLLLLSELLELNLLF